MCFYCLAIMASLLLENYGFSDLTIDLFRLNHVIRQLKTLLYEWKVLEHLVNHKSFKKKWINTGKAIDFFVPSKKVIATTVLLGSICPQNRWRSSHIVSDRFSHCHDNKWPNHSWIITQNKISSMTCACSMIALMVGSQNQLRWL